MVQAILAHAILQLELTLRPPARPLRAGMVLGSGGGRGPARPLLSEAALRRRRRNRQRAAEAAAVAAATDVLDLDIEDLYSLDWCLGMRAAKLHDDEKMHSYGQDFQQEGFAQEGSEAAACDDSAGIANVVPMALTAAMPQREALAQALVMKTSLSISFALGQPRAYEDKQRASENQQHASCDKERACGVPQRVRMDQQLASDDQQHTGDDVESACGGLHRACDDQPRAGHDQQHASYDQERACGDLQHADSDQQHASNGQQHDGDEESACDQPHAGDELRLACNDQERACGDQQHDGGNSQHAGADQQRASCDQDRACGDQQRASVSRQHAGDEQQRAGDDQERACGDQHAGGDQRRAGEEQQHASCEQERACGDRWRAGGGQLCAGNAQPRACDDLRRTSDDQQHVGDDREHAYSVQQHACDGRAKTARADPSQAARSAMYISVLAEVHGWSTSGMSVQDSLVRLADLAARYQKLGSSLLRAGCRAEGAQSLRRGVAYAMAAQSLTAKVATLGFGSCVETGSAVA